MKTLHLNLFGHFWDDINAGIKLYEYRRASIWLKRLDGKPFDVILLKKGYPKRGDTSRIIERPWRGFELQTITHPHFGAWPVEVCAIRVN